MEMQIIHRLFANLLNVSALLLTAPTQDLAGFEEQNCISKVLQPMFTAEALSFLLSEMSHQTLYEIQDKLGICLSFFIWEDHTLLIGPYVKSEYIEGNTEKLLVENHVPASYALTYRQFYTSLPLLYTNQILNTVNALIQAINPSAEPYRYRRLTGFVQRGQREAPRGSTTREHNDYSKIYKRYDAEQQFLHMITTGDIDRVVQLHKAMSSSAQASGIFQESSSYSNPVVGFSILRALARKAAEESGLSVITINDITQHYVQLVDASVNRKDMERYMLDMVMEITKAVHDHLLNHRSYPMHISRTIEYIDRCLSETISLPELADHVHVSASYLSKTFKETTGKTISDHIALERCKKAADLLSHSNHSIQEISSFVGYSDNNYFVKVFKKIYGMTPSAYRKSTVPPS